MAELREKAQLMDSQDLNRVVRRIAHEMVEHNKGTENMVLVGIHRRGVYIARRLQKLIEEAEDRRSPAASSTSRSTATTFTALAEQPIIHSTRMPVDIAGKHVFPRRRRALHGAHGARGSRGARRPRRPQIVQLAVIVDRGHRELPIHADICGRNVPTSKNEVIEVRVAELDGKDEVVICERDA